MITEAILNIIFLVVMGVISLFPTFPKFDFEHLNSVIRVVSLIDSFVSLRVVTSCMVVVLIVYNLRVIWSVIMWVARKLPGIE